MTISNAFIGYAINFPIQGGGSSTTMELPNPHAEFDTASDAGGSFSNTQVERISAAAPPPSSKQIAENSTRWFCVFDNHQGVSFGKQSDWKKHMTAFHKPGKKVWKCPESDCTVFFDSEKAFCQHHRKIHQCRRPCNHGNSAKIKSTMRRAFACGCRDCTALFFSWDDWIVHVADHMVNGMTLAQWHYNTLFRNLLRRPEVEEIWKRHVTDAAFPYNVSPRFNWRPHNTREQKANLEYLDGHHLALNARDLVLQAYQTGNEIRSTEELSDPSVLITEPVNLSAEHLPSNYMLDVQDVPIGNSQQFTLLRQQSSSMETIVQDPTFNFDSMAIHDESDVLQQLDAYKTNPSLQVAGSPSFSVPFLF